MHDLPAPLPAILRLCLWLALLAAVFVPLERLAGERPQRILRAQTAADLGYYFLTSLVPGLVLGAPLGLIAWAAHAALPAELTGWAAHLPFGWRAAAVLVVGELGYYWGHRWSHEIPLLWRFHAIHHSAEHMDWLVNTRAHPVDLVFTRLCGLAPVYALGLAAPGAGSAAALPLLLVGSVWGFFVHANLRWRFGPLEWLVSTPAFHHWHHANDGPDTYNKNYASMLPWVDLLFGTHIRRPAPPEHYGIDEAMPDSLAGQLVHPFTPRGETPTAVPAE